MIDLKARHPEWTRLSSIWNYLDSIYLGSDSWLEIKNDGYKPRANAKLFIPQHLGESPENWQQRINATYWDDLYGKGLRRIVDLAFFGGDINYDDRESCLFRNRNSISDNGDSLDLFLRSVAVSALTFGSCYVMIDRSYSEENSYKAVLENPAYMVKINPINLVNWGKDSHGNFTFIVILENVSQLQDDFSYDFFQGYRFYYEGRCYFYREVDNKFVEYRSSVDMGIDYIPIIEITGGYDLDPKKGKSPHFRFVADKNKILYTKQSDHSTKITLCCHPVAVLRDANRLEDEPLNIGPNSYVKIYDPNGSFGWEEPLALSIGQSADDINSLKASIDSDIAAFLINPKARQSASATNALLQVTEASLSSFVTSFVNDVNKLFLLYNKYCDDKSIDVLSLIPDIVQDKPKDAQSIFALLQLFEKGIVDLEYVKSYTDQVYLRT